MTNNYIKELEDKVGLYEKQIKDSVQVEKELVKARNRLKVQLYQSKAIYDFMVGCDISTSINDIYQNFYKLLSKVASIQCSGMFVFKRGESSLSLLSMTDSDTNTYIPESEFRIKAKLSKDIEDIELFNNYQDALKRHPELAEVMKVFSRKASPANEIDLNHAPVMVFLFKHEHTSEFVISYTIGYPLSTLSNFDPKLSADNIECFRLIRSALQRVYTHKITYEDLYRVVYHLKYNQRQEIEDPKYALSKSISQLKSTQSKILHNEKMAALGEMAAGIAHEINNPLMIIQGLSSQMQRGFKTPGSMDTEQLTKMAGLIESTVNRISKIIKGLQAFARNHDSSPMNNEPINKIVDEALELTALRFHSSFIETRYEKPAHDIFAMTRKTELQQVIINLLNNSYDAMSGLEEKWVNIEIEEEDENVRIIVTDSGKGIPRRVLSKIFQPFFTTKEVGKGTGLGLSISKGLLEQQGGKLSYNENSPNTQFIIRLMKSH